LDLDTSSPLSPLFRIPLFYTLSYINDRLYEVHLFRVQLFFSLSGFPYVLAVYHSLDRSARVPAALAVVGEAVLSAHILIALWEQGFEHLLQWNAHISLILRDGMFLLSDICLLIYLVKCVGRPWKSSAISSGSAGSNACADTATPLWSVFGGTILALFLVWKLCFLLP
jgi:hypothetical protein